MNDGKDNLSKGWADSDSSALKGFRCKVKKFRFSNGKKK